MKGLGSTIKQIFRGGRLRNGGTSKEAAALITNLSLDGEDLIENLGIKKTEVATAIVAAVNTEREKNFTAYPKSCKMKDKNASQTRRERQDKSSLKTISVSVEHLITFALNHFVAVEFHYHHIMLVALMTC